MPGIPSVYYGSEWGIEGVKGPYTDAPLRPKLDLSAMDSQSPQPDLLNVIRRLGDIRQKSPSLRHGDFQKIYVDHQQLAFLRQTPEETILVVLNSSAQSVDLVLPLPGKGHEFVDLLEPDAVFHSSDGSLQVLIPPSWGRLLKSVQ